MGRYSRVTKIEVERNNRVTKITFVRTRSRPIGASAWEHFGSLRSMTRVEGLLAGRVPDKLQINGWGVRLGYVFEHKPDTFIDKPRGTAIAFVDPHGQMTWWAPTDWPWYFHDAHGTLNMRGQQDITEALYGTMRRAQHHGWRVVDVHIAPA